MKKILFFTVMILSGSALANDTSSQDLLHETMAKSEAQKPETLNRIRDTIQVAKDVTETKEGYDSPSVKAINSFGDFFERRVKASNGGK